jgi:SHAQKYF class myb-like DNA-binding protein
MTIRAYHLTWSAYLCTCTPLSPVQLPSAKRVKLDLQRHAAALGSPGADNETAALSPVTASNRAAALTQQRKGVPWTTEEHRRFLAGLAAYGKGDWRSIARDYVPSRTPTQVACCIRSYFLLLIGEGDVVGGWLPGERLALGVAATQDLCLTRNCLPACAPLRRWRAMHRNTSCG